jgi:hypothetical protein
VGVSSIASQHSRASEQLWRQDDADLVADDRRLRGEGLKVELGRGLLEVHGLEHVHHGRSVRPETVGFPGCAEPIDLSEPNSVPMTAVTPIKYSMVSPPPNADRLPHPCAARRRGSAWPEAAMTTRRQDDHRSTEPIKGPGARLPRRACRKACQDLMPQPCRLGNWGKILPPGVDSDMRSYQPCPRPHSDCWLRP